MCPFNGGCPWQIFFSLFKKIVLQWSFYCPRDSASLNVFKISQENESFETSAVDFDRWNLASPLSSKRPVFFIFVLAYVLNRVKTHN